MNGPWENAVAVIAVFTLGQAAFMGLFLLVLVSVLLLPQRFVHEGVHPPPWWKSVRFWAVLVCAVQILIYWIWG